MSISGHDSTIDNETVDPVASAKAIYLAQLAEDDLFTACDATGIAISQVWDWRDEDVEFDREIRRIRPKNEPTDGGA
jgi:hypothetical protein